LFARAVETAITRVRDAASYERDRHSDTIEIASSSLARNCAGSDASFDALARLIDDVSTRCGFPTDDTHILTH